MPASDPYRLTPLAAKRAFDYPYDCHYQPFVVTGGNFLCPRVCAWPDAPQARQRLLAGRIPSLAVGSNRAARQLARKYANWPDAVTIPVWPVTVWGLDVHFAASIGHYGAIPATPFFAPRARVALMLVWLTVEEYVRMDESEGLGIAYDRFSVPVAGDASLPGPVGCVMVYRHQAGTLALAGGRSVGMHELPAHGTAAPRMNQRAMQRRLRDRLALDMPLSRFVAGNIHDPGLRQARIDQLGRLSRPAWEPVGCPMNQPLSTEPAGSQGTVAGKSPLLRLGSLAAGGFSRLNPG